MNKKLLLLTFLVYLTISAKGQESLSSDSLVISDIFIEGNNVTNKKVIYRELAFRLYETVSRDEVEYKRQTSINNLTKTSLFNFVEVNVSESSGNNLKIFVKLTERWYIWPTLFLGQTGTNFSEWWKTKDLDKLEYGFGIKINNFRGLGETLLLNYHMGNYIKYAMEYRGIYFDKAKRHSISILASYSAQNILPWDIKFNQQVILKGSHQLLNYTEIYIRYRYREGYFNSNLIEFRYYDSNIADTIYSLNPYYAGLNNLSQRYFNLKYEFTSDTRDSRVYPKTGYIFTVGINKKGLGILPHEYNAIDMNIQLFTYWKLYKQLYIASGLLYTSNMTDSYVFSSQTGLGYLQFVRGYEYYVANGSNTFLFKSLLKFQLLQQKVINLNIWPVRKIYQFNRVPLEIYTNVFFDAGYVYDKFDIYKRNSNTLVNKLMYSAGIGIDFMTYYDKVLRIDYSFNALGERGLFIHLKAAIR